jgi:hypothetical protein
MCQDVMSLTACQAQVYLQCCDAGYCCGKVCFSGPYYVYRVHLVLKLPVVTMSHLLL